MMLLEKKWLGHRKMKFFIVTKRKMLKIKPPRQWTPWYFENSKLPVWLSKISHITFALIRNLHNAIKLHDSCSAL